MILCVCDKSPLKHSEFRGDRLKLSTKGKYGLRAFIDLAVWGEEKPVSLNSIAERQEISVSYLEQLMARGDSAGGVAECVIDGLPAGIEILIYTVLTKYAYLIG